eukprot:25549-Amphidinium_carterae.1
MTHPKSKILDKILLHSAMQAASLTDTNQWPLQCAECEGATYQDQKHVTGLTSLVMECGTTVAVFGAYSI